ncbi:MAG: cytochrome c [Gammaproteobacteria bacterium]|jgi:4-cresol dehydrogenase (hydroxylating) cytochrome subunit|nr:cytochrome c [Gammaproteobacteria bacterium]
MKLFHSIFFKSLFIYITVSILSLFSTVLYADAAGQWRNGTHVYIKICSYCHDTGIGPELKGRNLPPEYVSNIVRKGFRAMPAFRATEIDKEELQMLSIHVGTAAANNQ